MMGVGTKFWIRKELKRARLLRGYGAARTFPISSFTVFLILFAQIVHFLYIFSMVTPGGHCHHAAFWVTGWFKFKAPFQWLGISTIFLVVVYGLRTVLRSTYITAPWETVFQGALVGVMSLVFLGQTAFLFPYAYPGATLIGKVFNALSPIELRLNEAEDELLWPYDFPEAPPDPRYSDEYGPYGWKLFKSSMSPTWAEYQAMHACRIQYDEEMAAYEKWQEDFENWRKFNWRYHR